MAMKLGRSSKPEAVIGLDDFGGSKNSPEEFVDRKGVHGIRIKR